MPFLDGAFDVARVFRVNVGHMGDIADTTEFFKVYRNDVNGSIAQFFSAEAESVWYRRRPNRCHRSCGFTFAARD